MARLVRYPGPGCVVEFMQGNQPQLAYVVEEQSGRLRVLTQNRREAKLPASRLLPWSGPAYPANLSRADTERLLDSHVAKRRELAAGIDVLELWSMAQGEVEQAKAEWFAELLWADPDPDQVAAMGRVLLDCKTHFKFHPPEFIPYSAETVESRLVEQEETRIREKLVGVGQAFLKELWQSGNGPVDVDKLRAKPDAETAPLLAAMLKARIADPDDKEPDLLWRELRRGLPEHPYLALLLAERWGIVPPHYNYLLDRAGYVTGESWAEPYADEVAQLRRRRDELDAAIDPRPFVSIDAATTTDIDDAFVAKCDGEAIRVSVAFACPAVHWDFSSPLGRAVLDRATSLYLPEGTSHMLPRELADDIYSLRQGEPRPALILDLRVDAGGEPTLTGLGFGRITVAANITYYQAEERLSADSASCADMAADTSTGLDRLDWAASRDLASRLRERRIRNGAVIIERQEPEIVLDDGDTPQVRLEVKEPTPAAQLLVSELMIVANELCARWAMEQGVPLYFRTQDAVLPKDAAGVWTEPEDVYRVVKHFGPTLLEIQPKPHKGLGVPAYCPVTSPLRRITDLINVAQIQRVLTTGQPMFSRDELESMQPSVSARLEAVGKVQRFRPRYWKMLHLLQNRKASTWTGVAVDECGGLVTLALPDAQIFVRAPRDMLGEKLYPGQRFALRFGKIDPLCNEIRVAEAHEEEADV
ncbi:ribonuclease catalytic domain-containing protein [Desulfocurvibacter africanus]|uniref:ribonuclease catalytic domain-containing protein n=1 Tax=Desulfocurvibacter africanus TaxID=873 RepID=UPI002FD881FF